MHRALISLILFTALPASFAQQPASLKPKLPALEGLDPVLLTQGKEMQGLESVTLERGRFLYQFVSLANKAKFQQHPEQYEIQLDGSCARMGAPTNGQPDAYFVYKNRIYIFGSSECYRRFSQNPTKYLPSEHPEPAWTIPPQSREKGEVLVKKMMVAMGGAEKWQSVHGVSETRKAKGPQGDATITVSFRAPDSFKTETAFGPNRFGVQFSPAGVYRLFRDEGVVVPESDARQRRGDWMRELMPMLFRLPKAIAISTAENQFTVNDDGILSTIELDPQTSRVAAIIWFGRGEGFGQFRVSYSDYRSIGGLQLPFRTEVTFDGAAMTPDRSWIVESCEINPDHLDSRFETPAKIRQQ